MKTNALIILTLCGLCCSSSLIGQTHYEAGVSYEFRSQSLTDKSKTSILTVQFDSQGKAYLQRKIENHRTGDVEATYLFAPSQEIVTDYSGVEISGDLNQYWVIPINGSGAAQSLGGNGNKLEIWCDCTKKKATCSVSYMVSRRDQINAKCVPDEGCPSCEMKVRVVSNENATGGAYSGGVVLLKATSIEWNN